MNYLLAAGLLAFPGIAEAAGFQDLAVVERAVVIAAGADIGEPGGPLAPVDRRLKLAACPKVAADPPAMNAITVRCPALGWRLRVPLARSEATSVAAAPSSSAAPVVRRGDVVELQAGSGSFTVSTQAVAQQDGAPGARIRVKTEGKGTMTFAEVVENGRVRIAGFK